MIRAKGRWFPWLFTGTRGSRPTVRPAKVLAGSEPADLPIVRPSRFKLVVNLTTARELGIRLSPSFLLIADEIIE